VAAWAAAGSRTEGYSPVNDAISWLAALHSPTRALMTGGFVLFGASMPLFGIAVREVLPGRAWMAAVATGVCTLAVAALPLDSGVDGLHALSAFLGYVTLAATPLLAARPLARLGRARAAGLSGLAGTVSAATLAISLLGPWHGLLQRVGLSVSDLWVCVTAFELLRRVKRVALEGGCIYPAGVYTLGTASTRRSVCLDTPRRRKR